MKTSSTRIKGTRHPDAVRWDKRYRAEFTSWLSHPPKKLLRDFAHLLPPKGLALDVASGIATNSFFLAERGLTPIALDISYVAMHIARDRFIDNGFPYNLAVCDLKGLWLPANHFEVIIDFCFLERSIFPKIVESLKPGGLLIFESYLESSVHSFNTNYYLKSGELADAFSALEIIHSKQTIREDGKQRSRRKVEQLVAQKLKLPGPNQGN